MKFKANTRRRALEYEKDLAARWKADQTFEKSVEVRPADNAYVFYDGPPFITGVPHHGTLLSSIVKDAVPRYWTMKGKRVERVWGWDCHGLPAERFVEKKLGITDRREIGTTTSLEEYIVACRTNLVATAGLWEDTVDRIGRWVDFEGAYKTMDNNYMESVWWAFKELYEKGKIYEGERVLMYCTRDATPLSKAEVTMDSGTYQDVTDPSVYVKFKLVAADGADSPAEYLLAWTTTPWTLTANTGVAINPDISYARVRVGDDILYVAAELAEKVFIDAKKQPIMHDILDVVKGSELVGRSYEPLFESRGEGAHKVWGADYVTLDDGTGIVHLAPAYGEVDFELAQQHGIPVVHTVDASGFYKDGEWKGELIWDINKTIAKTLHERGTVWRIDYIRHSYPHCHRCNTRLMYRAHPSWFMNIADQKQEMLERNEDISWFPEHLKHGRFAKTVETAPDWNLSRDRFWATPMPVWKGTDAQGVERIKVVGSYAELKELSGVELADYHRPWIDDVTFTIDGVEYRRIEKVMDCWFESGSMPFAQFHYPFENKEKFEANFPGDFVVEYVGQVRAWFYYMHAVSVGLFGKAPFKHVITTGVVAGNDGRKMSKSYGNFTDPTELMDKFSADSLRFLLLQSPLLNGEDFALIDKDVADIARKLTMIWNMYDFFTMYAEVDGWEWQGGLSDPLASLTNPLDRWVVSRVHQLQVDIDASMQDYDITSALKPVLPFIEDASNWYVRRSRRRFWKSGDDSDKADAYRTLHYVLVRLSMILAPFTPYLAEELYQRLTGGDSVHLLDWPDDGGVDEKTVQKMEYAREVINDGLSQRAKAAIKVRQPLKGIKLAGVPEYFADMEIGDYELVLMDELNVKSVEFTTAGDPRVELDLEITPALHREGLMREVVRYVQSARKEAGLNVDDRIVLSLTTGDAELSQAVAEHRDAIMAETLAETLLDAAPEGAHQTTATVEGVSLDIALAKATA